MSRLPPTVGVELFGQIYFWRTGEGFLLIACGTNCLLSFSRKYQYLLLYVLTVVYTVASLAYLVALSNFIKIQWFVTTAGIEAESSYTVHNQVKDLGNKMVRPLP